MSLFSRSSASRACASSWSRFLFECELKHGRVAMLAAFGFPVAEHFHPLFGGNIDVPSYVAYQQTPLQTFWPVVLLYVGIVEIFSVFTFENPFGKGGFWTLKDDRVRRPRPKRRAATRNDVVRLVDWRHAEASRVLSLRRCPATLAGTRWTCTPRTPRAASRCRQRN